MFDERRYKLGRDPKRSKYERQELAELKKKVKGHVETQTVFTQKELKVIQDQGEKDAELFESRVTDADIDRNFAVPVRDTKTGKRMIIVPKPPQPIYEEHAKGKLTVDFCKKACLTLCILLLLLNIYFANMWIYVEYFYPLEFFRRMFDNEPTAINRRALEINTNLYITVIALFYAIWGISVSTVFSYPPIIAGFFTWCPIFILPYLFFAGVQIFNLTQLDTATLKDLLLHSLWKYGYEKGTLAERNAWNQAQFSLKCCGVNGYEDWYVDWGYWLNRTDKPSNPLDIRRFPESCCPNYTLLHEYGYITRTRPYALLMLYCQYYPKVSLLTEGCFYKLILFFQSFTEQLALVALFIIGLMALAAGWTYAGYVRLQREAKKNQKYKYACRDWMIDFCFLRLCCKIKDSEYRRVGPAPLNLVYDSTYGRGVDTLEHRRPRLIDDLEVRERHLAEDEAEAALDEETRERYEPLFKDPLIDILDEYELDHKDSIVKATAEEEGEFADKRHRRRKRRKSRLLLPSDEVNEPSFPKDGDTDH